MPPTILPSRNPGWGLFGTIDHLGGRSAGDAAKAWAIAFAAIARATQASPEGVRAFLDSRHGRHFANSEPANAIRPSERANASGLARGRTLEAAIDAAVRRWMGWTIGRRTSRASGTPHGLPYLMGLVTHFDILAEADDGA